MGDNETMRETYRQEYQRLAAQYEEHSENPWRERPPGVG